MKKTLTIVLLLALLAVCFMLGRKTAPKSPESQVIRDTVTCTVYDTIVRERPVYKVSYITDTVHTWFTTIQHDSVLVEVPIERKVYQEDSLYYASVSGWRPSLDTLIVWPKTTTITITNTVKQQPPKFSFGLTAGPSVLATPQGRIYGGLGATVGLTYRF